MAAKLLKPGKSRDDFLVMARRENATNRHKCGCDPGVNGD
jgi:hypothetical protein